MIRYQYHQPKILFVGINPHPGSYSRGIPFSNNKMFWYLLKKAGLIYEDLKDLKSDTKLKFIFEKRFNDVYGLGLVNVINRPTKNVSALKKGEEKKGRLRILKIIKTEKPKVVCFVGKIAYEKFSGLKKFDYGWQEDVENSKVFVMHFPLRGSSAVRIGELKIIAQSAGIFK